MRSSLAQIDNFLEPLRVVSEKMVSPFLDLTIRLFMASIFWQSGWGKLDSLRNNDWDTVIYLFEKVHPVPFLTAEVAAVVTVAGELALSALLAAGLFGRFAAAGLLVMTLVIQFAVPEKYGIANHDHYYWMLLLGVILVKGPGPIALDRLMVRLLRK